MQIPNMIDPSRCRSARMTAENVELEKFGEPVVPAFEIPYHTEIMERFNGIDLDSARKVSRKRFLLSDGRYRPSAQCSHFLCP